MLSVFVETYGCQMNVADSNNLAQLLADRGYSATDKVRDADLIIVNTCSVRERAETRAKARITEYANIKKRHQQLWVIGCMAQRLGDHLKKEIPKIDRIIGSKDLEHVADDLDSFLATHTYLHSEKETRYNEISTFLPVMRGCDNFCAYCIVPLVRGREHSIPVDKLLSQAKKIVSKGACEITLLGQNVNSYCDNSKDFADLITLLHTIDGLKRIRFTTSHPKDISEKLIRTIAELPKVCNHIHLPVQSGSSSILKRMNRKYTQEHYLNKINTIKKFIPDVDITTDVMVGFPGETDDDFKQTLTLFKQIQFTSAFMFAFSIRPGTKSEKMSDQIPAPMIKERLTTLINLQTDITKEHYSNMVGKPVEALFTLQQKRKERAWMGQDYGCKRVLLECDQNIGGEIVTVNISNSTGMTLIGKRTDR